MGGWMGGYWEDWLLLAKEGVLLAMITNALRY